MDPFNQWGDENKTETHEMNEREPINQNQNTYMTNDARETSVESLNIDSMQAKQSHRNADTRKSYHYEVPKDSNFWKYMEQIKSILAGMGTSQSNSFGKKLTAVIEEKQIFAMKSLGALLLLLPCRSIAIVLWWNAYGMDHLPNGDV